MSSRRPVSRQTRGRAPAVIGVAGGGGSAPAVPTLTAPGSVAVFNTVAVTVSATSTDGDLDRIDWVLDPSGAAAIVATDSVAPYSQSWTPTSITDGDHVLVARAVRGAQSTDSAPVTINVGEVFHNLVSSVTVTRSWQSDFNATPSSWTDTKSSVAATQGVGGNQPTVVANASGKHPAVRFDGVDDFLRDATLDLPLLTATNVCVWFVFTIRTWTIATTPFCSATTFIDTSLNMDTSTPNLSIYNRTAASSLNNGATVGTPARVEACFKGSTGDSLKVGSISVTGINTGTSNPAAGWNIGALSNGTRAAAIDVFACMITLGIPSGAELAALSSAAAAMYPGVSV